MSDDESRDKDKDKRRSSSSRDRDRRSRRDDRDRDRDRKRRDRSRSPKKRSSSRDRERSSRRRSPSPVEAPEAPVEEREKAEYTVFVAQIHPKVDEKDLFEFFSHVGRVEDIRLIRDQRTQKSKGLCYVEFSLKESVHKAVALSGQLIGGYPITITIIEADKQKPSGGDGKAMRLYVGNLHVNVTDSDLRPIFDAFGDLDFIDLHKDPATGQSRGFGFVQYKNETDAQSALSRLNGLEIAGQNIKVGMVEGNAEAMGSLGELDEDASGGVAMTAQSRAQLMAKLQRDPTMGAAQVQVPSQPVNPFPNVPRIQPTTCVVIKNMFNPSEETDPEFHLDIKEDVEEEGMKYGKVRHIHVDKDDPAGRVFLCMPDVTGAQKLVNAFDGRWFAQRQIAAEFVIEQTYFAKFPDAGRA